MQEHTLDEMVDELAEFYESAGFEDYYERVLKNMDEPAIRRHYAETFAEKEIWSLKYENKQKDKLKLPSEIDFPLGSFIL